MVSKEGPQLAIEWNIWLHQMQNDSPHQLKSNQQEHNFFQLWYKDSGNTFQATNHIATNS
jgi:hypothetical protein